MSKQTIVESKLSLVEWAFSLNAIPTELWYKSFHEGSWGTADVISHFISWDRFMINNRILYILKNQEFPAVKVDIEAINTEASLYARSGISKEMLLSEFVSVRNELVALIKEIPENKFLEPFSGNQQVTLADYFTAIIEHDFKHKDQIDLFLYNELH